MNKKPFKAADGSTLMLIAFGAMLVAQLLIAFVLAGIQISNGQGSLAEEILNFVAMLVFQAIFISVYFIYVKKRNIISDYSPFNKITVWSVVAAPFLALVCMFGFMGVAYLFDFLLTRIGFSITGIDPTTPLSMVLMVAATVFAAPICEETIFRNAFLSGANKVRKDPLGLCLLSGICFALMHINPAQTVYQFCLGASIAYIVIKTGSVLPGMIMHSVSNAAALVISYTDIGMGIDAFFVKVDSNVLVLLLSCLVLPVLAVAIIWFISRLLSKAERGKYPSKFGERKVIWIDENTLEPIYEGEETPVVTEQNKMVKRGFNPMTGAPVIVDRLELQQSLLDDYYKKGDITNKRFRLMLILYLIITGIIWVLNLVSGIALTNSGL